MRKEQRLRRTWLATGEESARTQRLQTSREKKSLIAHEKRKAFRRDLHEAADQGGVWKLSKWARTAGDKPVELPTMPPLYTPEGMAITFEQKVKVLY